MKYITVYSRLLPIGKQMRAMAMWPFVIVKRSKRDEFTDRVRRHEEIHLRQQEEVSVVSVMLTVVLVIAGCGWWSLLVLPLYYYLYGIVYLFKGYDNAFEREAYNGQWQEDYLKKRKFWQWVKYIKH